ncbi:peptidase family m20/M25/M40 domain-containing protein [Phthorimaea operculella]|nr:peptidase family m20/M25/M40 domain-containing protein [Phthorimaea operculella]
MKSIGIQYFEALKRLKANNVTLLRDVYMTLVPGRGAQDMKSIGIQYFEALKRLKANNVTLLRDVYMTLMPDEEIGAENGMIPFLESKEFRALNIGFSLDEGAAYPLPISPVFYQDKVPWQIQVDCYGESAHSSTFPPTDQTAMGRCVKVINKMMEFREEEFQKYSTMGGNLNAGVYTSVNLNIVEGGTVPNVIPGQVTLVFDIRLGIAVDEEAFDRQLREWIEGDNVTMTYIIKDAQSPATVITDDNPYWTTFQQAVQTMGQGIIPIVPPGSTDARHVRNARFPALGFAPMPNTETLLHSVNERLSAETFLRGIDIYETLITSLANIPNDRLAVSPSAYVVNTTQA